jgi:NTE family protein
MKRIIFTLTLFISACLLLNGAGTGLALSGGGARGFAHIGVLKVFDEAGIKIDQIAGTSSGSLIAALYACGMSGAEIEDLVLSIDWEARVSDLVYRDRKLINFKHWQEESNLSLRIKNLTPVLPEGVTPGNAIINELFNLTWDYADCVDFDSLSIPLRIPASDIMSGEIVVFKSGNLHEVIFASFCFPTLLQPFALNNTYYIDGGILMNLPVEPLLEMGSETIIGVGANSPLRESSEINSVIDVLEQTAGVAVRTNVQHSIELCDFLIEPEISDYGMLQFRDMEAIIAAGEAAARKMLPELADLPRQVIPRDIKASVATRICLKNIRVEGNNTLKKAEILNYLGLEKGNCYSKSKITSAFSRAFNTDLFQMIYPVLQRDKEGYVLIVKVIEKHRDYIKLNLSYDTTDNITLRLLTDHKNLFQPNSRLLIALDVGENNSLCFDYVKNFGNNFGFYYHMFPYIREIPIYSYGKEFMKINSVKAIETGATGGLGLFFQKSMIVEFYSFIYDKNLYRNIGSEEISHLYFKSWGGGIKAYFETINDLTFGMRGVKILSKYTIAQSENRDNGRFQKSLQKIELLHPITNWLSLRYKFEYGSYFDKVIPYDPFYIGGLDSYMGLHKYDRSSSVYKINSISLRLNPYRQFYIESLINSLNLGVTDSWTIGKDLEWAAGMILGYQFPLLPVRLGIASNERGKLSGYINIGYNLDVFEFSRR